MAWIIVNEADDSLFWSNSWGWTTDDYDSFTDTEQKELNLPIEGKWQRTESKVR